MKDIIWKPIIGFEGCYEVSNAGQIKSLKHNNKADGVILKQQTVNSGYNVISLQLNRKRRVLTVHRIVAIAFFGYKEGLEINHKNGIKTDNRVDNLEWCTRSYNQKHIFFSGRGDKIRDLARKRMAIIGKKYAQHSSKKCYEIYQYDINNNLLKTYGSLRDVEKLTGIDRKQVSKNIKNNTIYKGYYWKIVN